MHDNYLEKISLYVDHQLNIQEEKELLAHIDTCEECKSYLQELKDIVLNLNSLEEFEPPKELHNEIMDKINIEYNKKNRTKKIINLNFSLKNVATVAAAYLVVTFSISALLNSFNGTESTSNSEMAYVKSYGTSIETNTMGAIASEAEVNVEEDTIENMEPRLFASPQKSMSGVNNTRYVEKNTYIDLNCENVEDVKITLMNSYNINNLNTNEDLYAYLEVEVSLDEYDGFADYIAGFGEISSTNSVVVDNTNQVIILNNKLKEKRLQIERYKELMKNSQDAGELLYLTNSISALEVEISQLNKEVTQLYNKHNNPVIILTANKTEVNIKTDEISLLEKIKNAFITSLNVTTDFFTYLSLIVAVLLPYLAVAIVIIYIIQKQRRGGYEK